MFGTSQTGVNDTLISQMTAENTTERPSVSFYVDDSSTGASYRPDHSDVEMLHLIAHRLHLISVAILGFLVLEVSVHVRPV